MTSWTPVPGLVSSVLAVASVEVPGPSKDEWFGALMAVLAVAVREVIWWFMHRRKASVDELPPLGGG